MSRKDIEFCLDYDINQLSEQPNYIEIEKIFEELKTEYAREEETNV